VHAISIVVTAVLKRLAHVIVQVDEYALIGKLLCNSVPDLESCSSLSELGVLLEDLIEHLGTIRLVKGVDKALFECLIGTVGHVIVDHLNGEHQANRFQSELWEPRDNVFDRWMLKILRYHHLLVSRLIAGIKMESIAIGIDDIASLGRKGEIQHSA
jgi:hypothetical protein